MVKLLVIAPKYPYPPDDGHTVRNYHLLRNLPKDCCYDFVTFGDRDLLNNPESLREQLGPSCKNVRIVGSNTLRKVEYSNVNILSKIKNIYFPSELSFGVPVYSDQMAEVVNERIESGNYDLTFFCGFSMFLYSNERNRRGPYVVDGVDSFSLFCETAYQKEKHVLNRIRQFVNYVWAIRYEKMHFRKAKNLIFTSPIDKQYAMKNAPASRIWVVPNGVDLEYFRPQNRLKGSTNTIVFTGVMDYPPNNDSIIYFIQEILLLIRKEFPGVTLTVVGKNPTRQLQSIAQRGRGIKVTGFVPDIRPFVEESDVYVAPMISGAGIKNKILEAWAMAKPVVGTPMSCNGLEAVDGENILISKTPDEFAARTVAIFRNPELARALGIKARRTVENHYSWEKQSAKLKAVFEEIISTL